MLILSVLILQVVTSHAVKVAVTPHLNADLAGFLPIHCIYQLLKSRAFSKHKVPIKVGIKNWSVATYPLSLRAEYMYSPHG
jgi:hypothetical protein